MGVQYKCKRCGVVSPHKNACFRCGCKEKIVVKLPPLVRKRRFLGGGMVMRIGI